MPTQSLIDGQAYLHTGVKIGDLRITHKSYSMDFEQGWHEHEQASIDLVLAGGGTGTYCGQRIVSSPGELGFYGCETRHRFRSGNKGIRSMHVAIPPSLFEDLGRDTTHRCVPMDHTRALGMATRIFCELTDPDRSSALEMESLCFELLGEVVGEVRRSRAKPAWITRACGYLYEHSETSVSLDELADFVGVSRGHLARVFRATTGVSPGEFHRRIRIGNAARMIADETAIARAARQTGFTDQSHLTRFFVAYTGMTPARFRRAFV